MKNINLKESIRGITMISLVVTIVIMLILAGVSVTVALNGGLIDAAEKATSGTQKAADGKEIQAAVIMAIGSDGRVNFTRLDLHLPEGFEKVSDGVYSSESGNTFTVDEYGNVEMSE